MPVELELRHWQARFVDAVVAHRRRDFLLVACPAAGKTKAAGAALAPLMRSRDADQVIVACPTVVVRDQWATELQALGFKMLISAPTTGWPPSVHGVCMTYAEIAARAETLAEACRGRRTVVILDEVHHGGEEMAWGSAIADAFADARMRLLLSGTPFRSDGATIPFVRYRRDGLCAEDFAYTYAQAVADGVCCPLAFRAHGGVITWVQDGKEQTAGFAQRLSAITERRRLRASLDPSKEYLRSMLQAAHHDLLARRRDVPDAAGLIVCDTQEHAMQVDAVLTELTGSIPLLAISDEPGSHKAIRAFAGEREDWIVSVRMVAEGVDIARLAVVVWATTAVTELMLRQVCGRALRTRADHPVLPAIVHMPADSRLERFAARIGEVHGGKPQGSSRDDTPAAGMSVARGISKRTAVEARPSASGPAAIVPELPERQVEVSQTPVSLTIAPPTLPLSERELEEAARAREQLRADLYGALSVLVELRRTIDHGYQMASAYEHLKAAVGLESRPSEASDEDLGRALAWAREHLTAFAARHPDMVQEVARARRRRRLATA